MKRSLLAAAAMLMLSSAAANAEMLFTIPPGVSQGVMNIRTGPGVNYALIGAIPSGQTVSASRCVERQDGIRGADWCLVTWSGLRGWVSQAGLMPYQPPPPPPIQSPYQRSTSPVEQGPADSKLECEPPVFVTGGEAVDRNPVVRTDIRYSVNDGAWHIVHILQSGQMVARDEQYAMTDDSNLSLKMLRWNGRWIRNPAVYMVGTVERNPRGDIVYSETQYKNNALQFQTQSRCYVSRDQ